MSKVTHEQATLPGALRTRTDAPNEAGRLTKAGDSLVPTNAVPATRSSTLRGVLAAVNIAIAGVVLLVCVALTIITSALHRTTTELGAAVESIRIYSNAEIDLLMHDRARDALVTTKLEERIRAGLDLAEHHVATERENDLLRKARTALETYVSESNGRDWKAGAAVYRDEQTGMVLYEHLEAAFATLDALVELNLAEAREARRRAATWDRLANNLAFVAAALTILLSSFIVRWMRNRAFRPVLALTDAMARFARGDRAARVVPGALAELGEAARGFNEMADSIARQRQEQAAFLGGVAHELRSPLSALAMSLANIDRQQLPRTTRTARALDAAGRQVSRLDRLVGDLLDAARADGGQLELILELRDAGDMIREALHAFHSAWGERPLDLSLAEQALPVRCDPLRVEQVLTNLIGNALKYSPPRTPIAITLTRRVGHAVFSVTDQGPGISPEDQHLLFEPFQRVDSSKRTAPGAGLGLFVAERIVSAHGGRIELESTSGHGSTFRVWLFFDHG